MEGGLMKNFYKKTDRENFSQPVSLYSVTPFQRRQTENESPLLKEGVAAERRDG